MAYNHNIVMIGPPGSGKGTQGKKLASTYALKHISTGECIRAAIHAEEPAALAVQQLMDKGKFAPDSYVCDLVRTFIPAEGGWILDGFPRNPGQTEWLDLQLPIDAIFVMQLDDDACAQRLQARRSCRDCSAIYNLLSMPSKKEGACDDCGGGLYQRPEDSPEVIEKRLRSYHKHTEPCISLFRQKRISIYTADAKNHPDIIFALWRDLFSLPPRKVH